ncbi:hypothetical protein AVEN_9407-1 [Araneus ventricosus]|uniref:Uncharacterized protein n=1 Tax=Araneus ventricosus TaxID=182803 RepID=A0A4Y2DMF1_ARAVE|nr:hypothetical protein AVEN_9407-1 [Araneus ventricosus]
MVLSCCPNLCSVFLEKVLSCLSQTLTSHTVDTFRNPSTLDLAYQYFLNATSDRFEVCPCSLDTLNFTCKTKSLVRGRSLSDIRGCSGPDKHHIRGSITIRKKKN